MNQLSLVHKIIFFFTVQSLSIRFVFLKRHILLNFDFSSSDNSKNESEKAEAAEDPSAANSEMDDTETEHDILASLGTEHDTEEFGSSAFGSNTSKCAALRL